MKIGYAYNGFLGDKKYEINRNFMFFKSTDRVSTPDGNAFYSWSIIHEAQQAKHDVVALFPDRDHPGWELEGVNLFKAFSGEKRAKAYDKLIKSHPGYTSPRSWILNHVQDCDVILLEWRFPNYRNSGPEKTSEDLDWQNLILKEARFHKVPVIAFDLDHKLTPEDEEEWSDVIESIVETSFKPKKGKIKRISTGIPFVMDDLEQFEMEEPINSFYGHNHVVYVGSRYERDESIDKYISDLSFDFKVDFYGNWLEPKYADCQEKWPYINYWPRIDQEDFRHVLKNAVTTPLLAKESYYETGFVTARILESLLYGSLPVGFKDHFGLDNLLPRKLIVGSTEEFTDLLNSKEIYDVKWRESTRKKIIKKARGWHDAKGFVANVLDRS